MRQWVKTANGSILRHSTASASSGVWTQIAGTVVDIGISPDPSQFGGPAGYTWSVATNGGGRRVAARSVPGRRARVRGS